jgi:hypothetical protein
MGAQVPANNKDIEDGDVFSINLLHPPFSFPPPTETFYEESIGPFSKALPESAKCLLLFELDNICGASGAVELFVRSLRHATWRARR